MKRQYEIQRSKAAPVLALVLALFVSGCGGTSVGNPLIGIESTSYGNGASLFQVLERWLGIRTAFAAPVSQFKFCVTKLKLTNSDGQPVTQGGAASIEAALGLIDISNAGVTTRWGEVSIPVDFNLRQLDIELHRDPEKCAGVDYSIYYNGSPLSRDLEFHFDFNPVVTVRAGDWLKLGLSNIAIALEQAAQAGAFTDERISEFLTADTKGTGTK
ncbi:MAG: hypothetical protein NDJ90_10850 [Oligoflexia bacterium]|nr:hypothetical protein [Oligoflexia bacterium]